MVEYFKSSEKFSNTKLPVDFHIWNQSRTALHTHDYCEIFLVMRGPVRYSINGQMLTLKKNTLSFVRPNDTHQFLPST